ncbi:MAG TPA: hypothetical protein VHT28_12480 [Silvibacterium sp.]|nr:hypothetical protein [Silvibacterium sp.]
MASSRFARRFYFLLLVLLPAFPTFCEKDPQLPDAPPVHASAPDQIAKSKWFGVVDPGEKVPPLYTRDKLMFWLHEEFGPLSLFPAFTSAGWGQLVDGDPKYGSDSGAFGDRLGAAVVRQASMRCFSDSLMPALTHEDPRYFRKAYGSIPQRGVYAAERVFVAQRDDGSHGFNYSDTMGRAAASALTMTYYPHPSANVRVAGQTWGVSLAGLAGNNLFLEFWPDLRDAMFHRHKKTN